MSANPATQAEFSTQLRRVLWATGAVLTLAMGIRHGFGFWLQPISESYHWSRETYSLAIALQNLLWGLFGPVAGICADRFGTYKVMLTGAFLYAAGLIWMASVSTPWLFIGGSGILIGAALACTTFAVVSGIIARNSTEQQRSSAFGISSAASSFGQFVMMPVDQFLIGHTGWQNALYLLSGLVLLVMLTAIWRLREPAPSATLIASQSPLAAVREAFGQRAFLLLLAGYFVCGFQLVFIGTNMPAYLKDKGISDASVAVIALGLIGLFNIFGSYLAGALGSRFPKRYLLSIIYALRALVIFIFVSVPLSVWTVYLFSAAMGALWLSTVPLTNGVIAGIFGVRYLSMLSGFVFFSHQVGSFIGAWMGGYFYSHFGNYDVVWMVVIALGIFASLVNLPIDERALNRSAPAQA